MRVFLDTNVLISAVATRGLCADVLREVLIRHQLVISESLLEELEKTLRYKIGVPKEFISEVIEMFRKDSHLALTSHPPDIEIEDKDDLVLLSGALSGEADLFVTGDKELLGLKRIGNMEIISPRTFWEKLQTQQSSEG